MSTAPETNAARGVTQPAAGAEVLRIGDVATAAGVSVDALRFYERRGLLRPSGRRASGYREYTPETIRLVRFIRRAQSLGFTLGEVEELVRLREGAWAGSGPAQLREAADAKVREIDRRIRELRALRGALDRLITECDAACAGAVPAGRQGGAFDCPLVEALELPAEPGAGDEPMRPPAPGRRVAKQKQVPAIIPSPTRRKP
jgi:DNA-binding transcriptional MerR regulator